MNPLIAGVGSRLVVDVSVALRSWMFEWVVYDSFTKEVYAKGSAWTSNDAFAEGLAYIDLIKREWPDCQDQTLITELKYRKTITSSCGRLKVTESL